ncbi:MAG: hypothetical protein QOG79_5761, partial [Mycobacterium sp.]|nr:hypothetical protein [Mycobacterium sp.]
MDRLVVVGASLAGLRAVEAARKTGFAGDITLIGGERHLPYDRPPLSKEFLEATEPGVEARIPFFRSDDVFPELDVELLLGEPATGLDVAPLAARRSADRPAGDASTAGALSAHRSRRRA